MDELTSATPQSPASATPLPASEPTSQTTSAPQQESAPSAAGSQSTDSSGKINLFESQEFRNYQAQMTRQVQAAQAAAAEAQRRAEETAMAQMDDYEKAVYRAQRAEAEIQQYRQNFEQQQLLMTRQQRITETSQRYGVPVERLKDAQTPQEMWEAVAEHLKGEATRASVVREQAIRQREAGNDVDLGGGAPVGGADSAMRQAWQNRDVTGYIRALRSGR